MAASLLQIISSFRFADFLDITIVSVCIYFLFMWIRRRASRSVVIGVIVVVTLYALARILNMYMTSQVFQAGLTAALVGLVIIFQDDIRMAIEQLSSIGTFKSKHHLVASNKTVDCLVDTLCNLARDRIGALVVIKGRESIDRHLSGGISVNGRISVPLLYSIFHPETPSHDGAVIIEGERIDKFGVRLPLSHNVEAIKDVGTRHTAALGLAERSDALVIAVSEERGTVSIAENGIMEKVDREVLRIRIDTFYNRIFPTPLSKKKRTYFTTNPGIKLLSIVAAITLWFTFVYRVDSISRSFSIPIVFKNIPDNFIIDETKPSEIKVTLSGPERSFTFEERTLNASFDISSMSEGIHTIAVTKQNITVPDGIFVNQILTKSFQLKATGFEERDIAIRLRTVGKARKNIDINDTKIHPATIKVQVHGDKRHTLTELYTESISLDSIVSPGTIKVRVALPHGVQLINNDDEFVKVQFGGGRINP
jgi:uncharacterized protein (TIGR00159 family)